MGKAKAIKKSFGTCFASIVRLRKYHAKYRYPIYHGCEYDRVLEVPFFIAFGPAFFFFYNDELLQARVALGPPRVWVSKNQNQ